MNPPESTEGPSLVPQLLRKASRRQSMVHLASAFRVQKPSWGSQAVLASLGLSDYLAYIRWDFAVAEEMVPYWLDEVHELIDPTVLSIRIGQIRELNTMIANPRVVQLGVNPQAPMLPEFARPLVYMAQNGMLYNELSYLGKAEIIEHEQGASYLDALGMRYPVKHGFIEDFRALQPRLHEITALQYLQAVKKSDRIWHPNTLRAAVMDYLEKVGRVSNPFAKPVGGSMVRGSVAAVPKPEAHSLRDELMSHLGIKA